MLQQDQQESGAQADGDRADQHHQRFFHVAAAVRLCREAAGPHAQEPEPPEHEIEDRSSHSHCPEIHRAFKVSHQPEVDHTEQRDRDVRDDVGDGEEKDAAVQDRGSV